MLFANDIVILEEEAQFWQKKHF